jgi:SAM-dependent methyltransferase
MARQRGICPVKKGALPDAVAFMETFDLVCLLDVLEHIDDDRASLRAVFDLLGTNGRMLLTVPACKFLWSAHDRALHHKRRYRKSELVAKVVEAGFRLDYVTYFNTFLFPVVAMVRLLHNLLGSRVDTDVALPAQGLNLVLQKIFAAEKALLPQLRLPFGVSLLLVARRP